MSVSCSRACARAWIFTVMASIDVPGSKAWPGKTFTGVRAAWQLGAAMACIDAPGSKDSWAMASIDVTRNQWVKQQGITTSYIKPLSKTKAKDISLQKAKKAKIDYTKKVSGVEEIN